MKILHIWDQAGTASVIAKWQRKLGHKATVIKNIKHDYTGITRFYGGVLVRNKYWFVIKSFLLASRYDVIHLHDAWFMVPLIAIYPNKKIIMHYHGSLVRTGIKDKWRKKWERLVSVILVATPDLLEYHYEKKPTFIPNPIDTDLFHPVQKGVNAFSSLKVGTDPKQLESLLQEHGIDVKLDCQENQKGYVGSTQYSEFPAKLAQYEYYVDLPIINGEIIKANSMCGLQAMAMGIKTVNFDFTISDSLPDKHRPENVVQEIMKYY